MDKLKTYSVGEDFGLSTTKFDSGNSSLNVHINLKKSNYTIFQIGPAHNQLYVDISVSRAIMVDKILSILKRYDLDVIYYDSMDKQKVKDNLTKANTEIKTFLKTFFDQYIQDQLSYALTMIKEFIFDIKG